MESQTEHSFTVIRGNVSRSIEKQRFYWVPRDWCIVKIPPPLLDETKSRSVSLAPSVRGYGGKLES